MKYLRQIMIVFLFSFLGELMRHLIPLPIPASIYGMVFLFSALQLKLLRVESVKGAGGFLTSILSVLFVPPVVSMLDCWELIRDHVVVIVAIFIFSTILCFAVSGWVSQWLILRKGDADHD